MRSHRLCNIERFVFLVCMSMAGMAVAKDKVVADGLPPKLHEAIRKAEVAYTAGDFETVWRALAPPINGLNEELAAKFDEALAAKKLPPARELLFAARFKLLMENRTGSLPAPSIRERLLLVKTLHDEVASLMQRIAGHPLLKEDASEPKNMAEFDRRIQEIRDLQGKLQLAGICVHYAGDLAGKLPDAARKKLSDNERESVLACEGDLAKTVQDSAGQMRELELETRLLRLRYGIEVLRQVPMTKEKFIAAAATRQDARFLKKELEPPVAPAPAGKGPKSKASAGTNEAANPPPPVSFHRATLISTDLANDVATLAARAETAAGPLGERAERFFMGLEFWLRGRYGWGPEVRGLVKSSAVLKQPELLMQVYMPENLLTLADLDQKPKPAGGQAETRSIRTEQKRVDTPTCVDRRHHYTWSWEDRGLHSSSNQKKVDQPFEIKDSLPEVANPLPGQSFTEQNLLKALRLGVVYYVDAAGVHAFSLKAPKVGRTVHLMTDEFVTNVSLPPQDPRLVYRIVGFTEYAQAVQYLDKFVAEASNGEFEAAGEIIRSQRAFRLVTNLSRQIEQPGPLSERSENPTDDFRRHSLEWMLALARVELGSMLAAFTSHADPFLSLAPTIFRKEQSANGPFGTAAYAELLLDGLRTHYWSIVREDLIANYYKAGVPEHHLVTYGRRAILGRRFVQAVLQFTGSGNARVSLSPPQRKELESWDQTFEKLQRIIFYCLTFKVGRQKVTTHGYDDDFARQGPWFKIERDQAPDLIRRILLLTDPTLEGCGCK